MGCRFTCRSEKHPVNLPQRDLKLGLCLPGQLSSWFFSDNLPILIFCKNIKIYQKNVCSLNHIFFLILPLSQFTFRFMKDVGKRIRDKRKSLGLTQDRLCEIVGISKSFLSEVETGKRNLSSSNLLDLAKALGVSCDYLLVGGDLPAGVAIPPSLAQFAANKGLSFKQVEVLLGMQRLIAAFHGKLKVFDPDWNGIYQWLKSNGS